MRRLGLVMMAALLMAPCANALEYEVQDQKRVIRVIGAIGGDIINQAEQIYKLAEASDDPIYMLINSPGGAVMPGMIFIDAMKAAQAKGVKFICASTVLAASMGYIMLSQCDERYALANTRLLFHPISFSTRRSRIQELAVDLAHTISEEEKIMKKLKEDLDISWKVFHTNYFAETFWQAERLGQVAPGFLTVVENVEGFGAFTYKYRRPRGFFNKAGVANKVLKRFEGGQ